MAIVFRCEKCSRRYRVADENAGRRGRCKSCGAVFRVPPPAAAVETSPSGTPVYRHAARERDFEPAIGDGESIEALSQHIETCLGEIDIVYHELLSDLVHIDVHRIPPTDERPYCTLITTGMSDLPMTAPAELDDVQYAELMVNLPPDRPLDQEDFEDENNYWPVRLLKMLARFPHEYETWLGVGHTVPNGDPPEPYAEETQFCCALLLPPIDAAEEFQTCEVSPGKIVNFYAVIPLYREEIDFKLKRGLDPLLERFDRAGIGPVVDVGRPNVCRRRGLFRR